MKNAATYNSQFKLLAESLCLIEYLQMFERAFGFVVLRIPSVTDKNI